MRVSHVAVWVRDLEGMKSFYVRNFGAVSNEKYENKVKGFESYFLTFSDGARLEIMRRKDIVNAANAGEPTERIGFAHLALSCGSEAEVDRLTGDLSAAGVLVVSGPRRTGDGYYESVIRDPEGNLLEITV
jgi:lactoylglutathione lyase